MSWKKSIKDEIVRYDYDLGYFTLKEFFRTSLNNLQMKYPNNKTCKASVQGNLQKLRDDNYLEFIDNNGTYKVISKENDEWIHFVNKYHNYKYYN